MEDHLDKLLVHLGQVDGRREGDAPGLLLLEVDVRGLLVQTDANALLGNRQMMGLGALSHRSPVRKNKVFLSGFTKISGTAAKRCATKCRATKRRATKCDKTSRDKIAHGGTSPFQNAIFSTIFLPASG
jgi:hypothetical protein